jgi:hypothetical protein
MCGSTGIISQEIDNLNYRGNTEMQDDQAREYSKNSLSWWSETYDQATLVLVSRIAHTREEEQHQDGIYVGMVS